MSFPIYKYYNEAKIAYYSYRYLKWVIVEKGYPSDGATGAIDIKNSISWWVHDKLKDQKKFEDGSSCSNFQASMILFDILWEERRVIRAIPWGVGTYLFGEVKKLITLMN